MTRPFSLRRWCNHNREFFWDALRVFLAPMAEPSRGERFKFSRDWLRGEATRMTDPRSASMSRRLNLPPSYLLIHRVSTAGTGVLCQLECEGPFRAEVLRWMPGYLDTGGTDSEPAGTGGGPDDLLPDALTPGR